MSDRLAALDRVLAQSTDPSSGRAPTEYVLVMVDGSARVFDTSENIVLPPQAVDEALGALGYWWAPPDDLDLTVPLRSASWLDHRDEYRAFRAKRRSEPSALAQRASRRLDWSRTSAFSDADETTPEDLTRRWRREAGEQPLRVLAYVDDNDDFQTVERLLGDDASLALPGDEIWVVSDNGFEPDQAQKSVRPARVVPIDRESPRQQARLERSAFSFVIWADTELEPPHDLFDDRTDAIVVESSRPKSEFAVRRLLDGKGEMPVFLAYQPMTTRLWQAGTTEPDRVSLRRCLTAMWASGSNVQKVLNTIGRVIPMLRPGMEPVRNATVSAGVSLARSDLEELLEDLERKVSIEVDEILEAVDWARAHPGTPLVDRRD